MGCVLVQRRPLRVFSCGPPPVFNHELATSAHAMKNIVSLVSRYDWVPRLSLGNVRRLKAQVIQIFDDIERRQRQEQEMRQRQAAASDAERNRRGERKKSPSRPALSQWDLMRSRKNVFSANYVDNIASDPAFYQQVRAVKSLVRPNKNSDRESRVVPYDYSCKTTLRMLCYKTTATFQLEICIWRVESFT